MDGIVLILNDSEGIYLPKNFVEKLAECIVTGKQIK